MRNLGIEVWHDVARIVCKKLLIQYNKRSMISIWNPWQEKYILPNSIFFLWYTSSTPQNGILELQNLIKFLVTCL